MPEGMRYKGAPGDLTAIHLGREQIELLERQSLEIFTIMANAGKPFAMCLSAILMSGLQWGSVLTKQEIEPRKPDYLEM